MRKRVSKNGLTVNAIAGSYVVVLGLDISDGKRKGLRGFAIKRTDKTEGEMYWMNGTKTFKSVEPHPAPGGQYSSLFHPFQSFQWSDYSVKPGYSYTYTVVAMYGPVNALTQGPSVDVSVTTEPIEGAAHTIHFNRGSVATQEYARRFQNLPPTPLKKGGPSAGQAAFDWLSRGLFEGIVTFIQRATGPGFGLKGCFYEFQWPAVLDELRKAKSRGVDVSIVFDDIDNATGPHKHNEAAIETAKIKSLTKPRQNGTLMHNKFIVLTKNGKAIAVLFGSTNLTLNGLFGHANCTHVVENKDIAAKYLEFYAKLRTDPITTKGNTYKTWTIDETPAPASEFVEGMAPVFSPRANLDALNWYGAMGGAANGALFMTFAFGMNGVFRNVYGRKDNVLRVGLMEKEWNGANKEAQIAAIRQIQALPNVVIAIGNKIPLNGFDQWLGEMEKIDPKAHVLWVHLKFMLIDPLSSHPIVVIGSANFSDASTTTNDENMLVIKDNTRVADIYLGEYMRLYSHYAFREAVAIFLQKNPHATPQDMTQGFLIEDGDWTFDAFNPKDTTARRAWRLYFCGVGRILWRAQAIVPRDNFAEDRQGGGSEARTVAPHRSGLSPASLMTFAQRAASLRMWAVNSAGVVGAGSCPSSTIFCANCGSPNIFFTSALSRATIAAGRPAGPARAYQVPTWNPGSVSAIVGTSGNAGERLVPPWPMARTLPLFMRPSTAGMLLNMNCA